jgi:hypothetical protein
MNINLRQRYQGTVPDYGLLHMEANWTLIFTSLYRYQKDSKQKSDKKVAYTVPK